MRGNMLNRLIALLPVALLAAMPGLAQQQNTQQNTGQSQTGDAVADAARKAREEKKEAPKPKKVFTNDDIAPAKQAPASAEAQPQAGEKPAAQGQTTQSGKEGASQDTGTPKEDPNGEAAWRKRFADQRAKIAKAQTELDVLQRELQQSQVQYYPDPQKAMQQQFSRKDIDEKQAKIDAKKQEIAQLNQELSDMEDQLKKAGGDPGWARY